MNDKLILLLDIFRSRQDTWQHAAWLSPEEVNELAENLGIRSGELSAFMDELYREKLIALKSGGTVMVTIAGRQALNKAQNRAGAGVNGNTLTALLFADVAGYSNLSEPQLEVFMTKVLPELANVVVDPCRHKFQELNTWGDAIVASSQDPYELMKFALNLRDFFRNRNWHAEPSGRRSVW
jgi:class 3 adenylate cyclase